MKCNILRESYFRRFLITATFILLNGCGEDGPPRIAVYGTVTWKGQLVPRGVVYFSPDSSKGNSGPKGFALLADGAFDTQRSPGKGCVLGPHRVEIQGFDGQNIRDGHPYGNQLFGSYETTLDVSPEGPRVELVVPDAVKVISPRHNEPE